MLIDYWSLVIFQIRCQMNKCFLTICIILVTLFLVACDCDCDVGARTVKVRYMRNGENAIFGSNPLINPDSLTYYLQDFPAIQYHVFISSQDSTLGLQLTRGETYLLDLDGIRIDTFTGLYRERSVKGCCKSEIDLHEVRINNQVVCEEECGGIFDIEI